MQTSNRESFAKVSLDNFTLSEFYKAVVRCVLRQISCKLMSHACATRKRRFFSGIYATDNRRIWVSCKEM